MARSHYLRFCVSTYSEWSQRSMIGNKQRTPPPVRVQRLPYIQRRVQSSHRVQYKKKTKMNLMLCFNLIKRKRILWVILNKKHFLYNLVNNFGFFFLMIVNNSIIYIFWYVFESRSWLKMKCVVFLFSDKKKKYNCKNHYPLFEVFVKCGKHSWKYSSRGSTNSVQLNISCQTWICF